LVEINRNLPVGSDPRNQKTYRFRMTPVRFVITELARLVFPLLIKTTVEGIENVPANGQVILVSNHMTNFDVFPIQLSIDRLIFFMGKAELFKNTIFDFLYRELGAFPVYRGERDEWAMEHAQAILDRGLVLGMFPEGGRSKEGKLRPAKTGAARLALKNECPILPLALDGTQKIIELFPKRAEVNICFGELVYPDPEETALNLTDRFMFRVAELLPPVIRGAYALRPEGFDDVYEENANRLPGRLRHHR
jgi:1-acyl-sn-glycerol-3-phosphate acyltransferase